MVFGIDQFGHTGHVDNRMRHARASADPDAGSANGYGDPHCHTAAYQYSYADTDSYAGSGNPYSRAYGGGPGVHAPDSSR